MGRLKRETSMPRVTGVAPQFLVADVVRAAEYYRDRLGFRIVGYFFEDPPVFAMVGRDDKIIMLSLMTGGTTGTRGGSNRAHKPEAIDAYLWVDDVEALHAEFQRNRADIVMPPTMRIYGMKEIEVRDLDGYLLCFGQDVPASTPA
jgi:catechol 2,3-dioxygenase-like lactoylglutathione lyase family enzyme